MRKTTLIINSIVVVFFSRAFFPIRISPNDTLNLLLASLSLSRRLFTPGQLSEFTEEALNSPMVNKFLSEDLENSMRKEIADALKSEM